MKNFSEGFINKLGEETDFIKRKRKVSAFHFVNSLMFVSSNQSNTSLPDISADLQQQFTVAISKEGIHKKFSPQAVSFLKALIKSHISEHLVLQDDVELKNTLRL